MSHTKQIIIKTLVGRVGYTIRVTIALIRKSSKCYYEMISNLNSHLSGSNAGESPLDGYEN